MSNAASPIGFDKFFALVNGTEKMIIAGVLSLFVSIPVYRFYADGTMIVMAVLVSATVITFLLLMYLYLSSYYKGYIESVQAETHLIQGWDTAVALLSPAFFKGKAYAKIEIDIKVAASAPQKDRQRLLEFCAAFVAEGSKILTHASLNDLTIDLKFMVGKQSAFVIKKLFNELSAVLKQHRVGQAKAEVRFVAEEDRARSN